MQQNRNYIVEQDLKDSAEDLFHYQYRNNPLYRSFIDHLGYDVDCEFNFSSIPYLPISAFKHHIIKTGHWNSDIIYTSSGTGGNASSHHVRNNDDYLKNCKLGFEQFYGSLKEYTFLALLPGYLDRKGSSLISMLQYFIEESDDSNSGFFLRNHEALLEVLEECRINNRKTILWGVTYALLDLGEQYNIDWPELTVLETGGMKGTRKEMIKSDLHRVLKALYGVPFIHSEYGMTELLSQAYSLGDGLFIPSNTMHVHCRPIDDPLGHAPLNKTGQLHIFDQANKDGVSFIATEDLGRMRDAHSFEIMGRKDHAEQRGCNLLIEEIGM